MFGSKEPSMDAEVISLAMDSLKKLGVGTFAYCGELETVQLPENIDLVPDFLFMECEKLK